MLQFHERIPCLISWTSPNHKEKWHAVIVPGAGVSGRATREIFFYKADDHCTGSHQHNYALTTNEAIKMAKEIIRGRYEAIKRDRLNDEKRAAGL
jgi:hypothetical protein